MYNHENPFRNRINQEKKKKDFFIWGSVIFPPAKCIDGTQPLIMVRS